MSMKPEESFEKMLAMGFMFAQTNSTWCCLKQPSKLVYSLLDFVLHFATFN